MIALALVLACGGEPTPTQPSPAPAAAPAEPTEPLPIAPAREAKFTPHPVPVGPDLQKALEVLGAVVDTRANDPEDPWALAHALLARGEALTLPDGQPVVPYLFSRYARVVTVGGRPLPAFPREANGVSIEPHTDLILKSLTEIGVNPEQVVQVEGQSFEVGDAWRHSLLTTWLSKTDGKASFDSPNDMPWALQGLAAWAPPGLHWTADNGIAVELDYLTRLTVHVLHSESEFMIQAMEAGQDFEKRGQGIFQYTCGGAHLLQGAAAAVARGFGGPEERTRLQLQGRLLFYRLPREVDIYQRAIEQQPRAKLILMAQQLKFVGHWLESAHKLSALGLYSPDAAEQQLMAQAVDLLIGTVKTLKGLGALDNLDQIRTDNKQLYLDLVGDSAHALRGLMLATGKQPVVN